jgi:carboxymethylenebutenolidase
MRDQLSHHERYLVEEFAGDYLDRRLNRRDLLRKVLYLTGSIPLTATTLFSLGCSDDSDPGSAGAVDTATAEPTPVPSPVGPGVSATDPAIEALEISFTGPASQISGYLARPRAAGNHPALLVIHENRGLQDHFKDVARRYAKEGFVALAIDLLSRYGGTSQDANQNMALIGNVSRAPQDAVADLQAGLGYLKQQSFVRTTSLGVTGFCFGGNFTWEMAMSTPELKAAVPYYGTVSMPDRLAGLQAAVLAIYGETDARVTGTAADVESRLRAAGKTFEVKIYPGAGHAFFNETNANSYNPAAASQAWVETLAWFRRHLSA